MEELIARLTIKMDFSLLLRSKEINLSVEKKDPIGIVRYEDLMNQINSFESTLLFVEMSKEAALRFTLLKRKHVK